MKVEGVTMRPDPKPVGGGPLTRGELGLCGAAATVLGVLSVLVPILSWVALPAGGMWLAAAVAHLPRGG